MQVRLGSRSRGQPSPAPEDPVGRKSVDGPPSTPPGADSELFLAVYEDLRGLARAQMKGQAVGHTLQPTALVNEAYMRLVGDRASFESRDHFLRVAARAMRQILVDHGRRRMADKRPPRDRRVELEPLLESLSYDYEARAVDLVTLDRALVQLETRDPKLAELVELHFFGGQSMEECARCLGISERQAFRWWKTARAFLHREVEQ